MPPRLNHRKSTNGCYRCKARKVKCNEARPKCANCERHQVPCEYPEFTPRIFNPSKPAQAQAQAQQPPRALPAPAFSSTQATELKLMHHYVTQTAGTMNGAQQPSIRAMWVDAVPDMAFEYEPLLHTLLAVAAMHRSTTHPDEMDHMREAHQAHFGFALEHHRDVAANLSPSISEGVCMNTILLSLYTLTLRLEATSQPYEPPLAWLNMAHGIRTVLRNVMPQLLDSKSRIMPLLNASRVLYDGSNTANQKAFQFLLECYPEEMDEELRSVYSECIAYLEPFFVAVRSGESEFDLRRRFTAFPPILSILFIRLVAENRPRALVILAYLFALVRPAENIWWLKGTPEREVRGIYSILPAEWKWTMSWPMHVAVENPETIPMPVAGPGPALLFI